MPCEDWSRSDVILVNSCTLTGRADRDVRKFIQKAARENPGTRIVVTGCYAERAPAELEAMPNVVAVLPNSAKGLLPERVLELVGCEAAGAARSVRGPEEDAEASFRSRALLKVQDGCDNRCTFCVIPSVRGRGASVGRDEVLTCVRNLAGHGFREIVLAGIHLSSYGEDLEPRGSLLGLLRELEAVPGLGRIRLSSLDPRKSDAALIEHIASSPMICPHFHLSLQHASERVLSPRKARARAACGSAARPAGWAGSSSRMRSGARHAG